MSHEDRQAELREKTQQLLQGALKHVRVAALAAALVPLGAVGASPAVAQDCGSGGCPPTPTVAVSDTPTPTPNETATNTMPVTWTPTDMPTETPTQTETPTVLPMNTPADTPTHTPTQTVTNTMTFTWTPTDAATGTPTHTETRTVVPSTPADTATPAATQTAANSLTATSTPTETPTVVPTDTPADTRTPTATQTATNSLTVTGTPRDTATQTPTSAATRTRTSIEARTPTNTARQTRTRTSIETRTPTNTATRTRTPSATRTATPTQTPTATKAPCSASSIQASFNDAAIAGGNCIWFNSAFLPIGLDAGPTTIVVQNQSVRFTANSQPFTVSVPRAVITFDANVTSATTTFDAAAQQWVTEVPLRFDREVFVSGVMAPVTGGLPGGINPVTWSGTFSSDAGRVRLLWTWGAAVYTKCDTGLAALGVKPVDGLARNPYPSFDPAGTPETIKSFVTGGARGGGRPNYTGFPSRSSFVNPCD